MTGINSQSESFRRLNPHLFAPASTCGPGEKLEMPLHDKIMQHCAAQFPRWLYIRARSDMASTIAVGAQDFTIFLPGGRVLCVECKSATGKCSPEQAGWHFEMQRLGHHVYIVRSWGEFLECLQTHNR
jgi:hypothetical protein